MHLKTNVIWKAMYTTYFLFLYFNFSHFCFVNFRYSLKSLRFLLLSLLLLLKYTFLLFCYYYLCIYFLCFFLFVSIFIRYIKFCKTFFFFASSLFNIFFFFSHQFYSRALHVQQLCGFVSSLVRNKQTMFGNFGMQLNFVFAVFYELCCSVFLFFCFFRRKKNLTFVFNRRKTKIIKLTK